MCSQISTCCRFVTISDTRIFPSLKGYGLAKGASPRRVIASRHWKYVAQLVIVFAAYFIAGKLGQATANVRSNNLGPVWPAYGVALAAILLCGYRIWPAVSLGMFVIAALSPEPYLTALGQGAASTAAVLIGTFLLHRVAKFDITLSRLRDVFALFFLGAFASAIVSSSIGIFVLHASHISSYGGMGSAWLIYWLGDSTGVLLMTPLVLTFPDLVRIRTWARWAEFICLVAVLVAICGIVFSDLSIVPVRMIAFAVLPLIIWAAIRFGVSGAALSIFLVATVATVRTAIGSGSFASSTPFIDGIQMDVFFTLLSLTGLTFAAVYTERELAQRQREQSLREQVVMEVRLQNQDLLRQHEERLRLAQQAARIGTFEWNIQTGVSTWTPELESIYGLPPGGFSGTQAAWKELLHPEDRAGVMELAEQSMKTGMPMQAEWRTVWPDGSIHWIAGRWQVFMDAAGEPARMVGVNSDITERKRAEERLLEYEKAVEGAEDMIGVIDRDYRFLLANRQYLKMRNLTREQVVGHVISEVLTKEEFDTVIKPKLDECFQGQVVKYERKFSYPNVGERDLMLSYFPIEGVKGVDRAACILHDITDRKRAEEALRESEERLRLAVQAGRMFAYSWDADTDVIERSGESTDILGVSNENAGTGAAVFAMVHADDREKLQAALANLTVEHPTLKISYRIMRPDGVVIWVERNSRGYFDSHGKLKRVVGMVADITERKRAKDALAEMTRRLIAAQEQERARIARELHDDVNQRIAMLSVELEQLQQSPAELQSRVHEFRKELRQISDDVQALSHDLHSSKLEYLGVIPGMKSWCREVAERHKIEVAFRTDSPGNLPHEVGLPLFRVLQEAVNNSIKHSGVKQVEVQLWEDSGEIHLSVRDSGKGFDVETAMRGKGLGLTSMQERVRLLNGTIHIQSRPMGGTNIYVRIPLDGKSDAEQLSA